MRRPLCIVCIGLVITILLFYRVRPIKVGLPEVACDTEWIVTGTVCDKELTDAGAVCLLDIAEGRSTLANKNLLQGYRIRITFEEDGLAIPKIGEKITIRLQLNNYRMATNPGEFDLRRHYGIRGIDGYGVPGNYRVVAKGDWFDTVKERICHYRYALKQTLYECLPQQEAGILCAMLLGLRGEMDTELKDDFGRNGIAHILSISGLHIALLGQMIHKLLKRLPIPMGVSAGISVLVMILYGLLTGMNTPALRAIVMFALRLGATVCGRTYDMSIATSIAAMLILAENPKYIYDCGFLLSFTAIMGVAVVYPAMKDLLSRDAKEGRMATAKGKSANTKTASERGRLRKSADRIVDMLCLSFSIQLSGLPVLAWFYYEIPLYAILLNLVVIPLMTPIMLCGIGGMLVGWWNQMLGVILLWPERYLLAIQIGMSKGADRLSENVPILFRPVITGRPAIWIVIVYYVLLAIVTCSSVWRSLRGVAVGIAMVVLLIPMRPRNQVWMLDVGQGDCMCIFGSRGDCTVIDCGSTGRENVGENVLIPFLKYMGVRRVEQCFVTHPDADHVNGIVELLENRGADVGRLYIAQAFMTDDTDVVNGNSVDNNWIMQMTGVVNNRKTTISTLQPGDCILGHGWKAYVLHPTEDYDVTNKNDASLVMLIEWSGKTILSTGDLECTGEKRVLESLDEMHFFGRLDILKVAHHGSKNATSEMFLKRLRPKLAMISCGRSNRYGHPHRETVDRLKEAGGQICTTAQFGAMRLTVEAGELYLFRYLVPE